MSFDMFLCDEPYYQNITPPLPNTIFQEYSTNIFNDRLSNSSIDTFQQEISLKNSNQNPNSTQYISQISPNGIDLIDHIAQNLSSNSPPTQLLESLSLSNMSNSCDLFTNYSVNDVKIEEFNYDNSFFINNNIGFSNSYNEDHCLDKFMQRSYSSNSFEVKNNLLFHPGFDPASNVTEYGSSDIGSDFGSGHMRRVCSTGDLPVNAPEGVNQIGQQGVCSTKGAFGGEGNVIEDGNFKVGRYSAEERKERIDRYRAKRTLRNFNKTIKYVCRKTLADNRPRIRGRFARNDENGEILNSKHIHRYIDDDDLWVDNLQEEEGARLGGGGQRGRLVSNFGRIQFQYFGYC